MSETSTEAVTSARVTRWRTKGAPEVEAVHWDGAVNTATTIINWMLACGGTARYHDGPSALSVDTVDGTRVAVPGDWIARYPAGTFRPFTEDEFTDLYEPAGEADVPVDAGELAAFGLLLERTEKALTGLQSKLDAEVAEAVAAERERIRSAADGLKFTLFRPGNGPAHTQALDVVPLEALLGILGKDGDGNG